MSLPNTILSIGDYAFSHTRIKDIRLPSSLTSIGVGAFEYSELCSIALPDNIEDIPSSCFAYCFSLKSIQLPNNLDQLVGLLLIMSALCLHCLHRISLRFCHRFHNLHCQHAWVCISCNGRQKIYHARQKILSEVPNIFSPYTGNPPSRSCACVSAAVACSSCVGEFLSVYTPKCVDYQIETLR